MITLLNELNKLSFILAPIFYRLLFMSVAALCIGVVIMLLRRFADKRISPFWKRAMWVLVFICLAVPYRPQSDTAVLNNVEQLQNISYREEYDRIKTERHDFLAVNELTAETQAEYETLQKNEQIVHWQSLVFDAALPLLWFTGIVFITIFTIAGRIRLAYMLNKNKINADGRYFEILEKCKARLGIKTKVNIVVQSYIGSPALLGVISPTVILPVFINDMDDDKVEYILLHELAHYKRLDMFYNYILIVLQVVYWFNPLVWIMFRFIRQDMELANDAYVLKYIGNENEKQYSASLVEVLARYSNISFVPKLLCMVDGKDNMERRIKMIKLGETFKKRRIVIAVGSLIIIGITAAVFLTTAANKSLSEPPDVTITTDGHTIEWFVGLNEWGNAIYDRMSAYQYAYKQNPEMTGLPVISSNSLITIDFGDYRPDKVSVSFDYLTASNTEWSVMERQNVMTSNLGTERFSFDFSPTETSYFTDIIVGRVYMITARFGQNECEYAFVTADTQDYSTLYSAKTPYVGDNSKVINIVDNIDLSKMMLSGLSRDKIELSTSDEPFGIYITYKTADSEYDYYFKNTDEGFKGKRDVFMANAAVLFSLIDNLDFVNYYIEDYRTDNAIEMTFHNQYSRHYTRDTINDVMELDVRNFAETKESFSKFMQELYSVHFLEARYYQEQNEKNDIAVNMSVQYANPTGVSYFFENNTENEYTYGEHYTLFVLKNGEWEAVPYIIENWGFRDIGYTLAPQSTSGIISIDWQWLYGKLHDGDYRIQKEILLVRSSGDYDTFTLEADCTIYGDKADAEYNSEDGNNSERQSAITFWVKPDESAQVIGEVAAGQWLNSYKDAKMSNLKRISDYNIDSVNVVFGSPLPGHSFQDMAYNIFVRVNYSITTASDEYISPDDGVSGKGTFDGLSRVLYVKSLDNGNYEIVGEGTGGGEQEFIPRNQTYNNQDTSIWIDFATAELLSHYYSYFEYDNDIFEQSENIIIYTDKVLKDFSYIKIGHISTDNEISFFVEQVLYSADISPEKPLVVKTFLPETIPYDGITFTDENNVQRYFYIIQSGLDGSILLVEFSL